MQLSSQTWVHRRYGSFARQAIDGRARRRNGKTAERFDRRIGAMRISEFKECLSQAFEQASWTRKAKSNPQISTYEAWSNYHDATVSQAWDAEVSEIMLDNFRSDFPGIASNQ